MNFKKMTDPTIVNGDKVDTSDWKSPYLVFPTKNANVYKVDNEVVSWEFNGDSEHCLQNFIVIHLDEPGAASALAAYGAELDDIRAILVHQNVMYGTEIREGYIEYLERRSARMYDAAEQASKFVEQISRDE